VSHIDTPALFEINYCVERWRLNNYNFLMLLRFLVSVGLSVQDLGKFKTKAVPLHATKALGGRGDIAPTYSQRWH
jgi:hypothetical protein